MASPRSLARRLAADPDGWRHLVQPGPRRWAVCLEVGALHEAWLLGWPAGAALDLHDHGGSAGAFVVVDGELDEVSTTAGSTASPVRRRLRRGDAVAFGADHVHAVEPVGELAVSVHVYAPRLRAMGFYDRWDGSAPVLRHVAEQPAPVPLLASRPLGRLAHPAGSALAQRDAG